MRTIHEPTYWAYVPHALPPKIDVDWELANLLSTAGTKLGELSGAGQLLLNPHLLIRPFIRREAVMSSRIENTQSGLDDLFLFEADKEEPSPVSDVQEVINYVRAMEYGIEQLEALPISSRLICGIHEILMKGVRGEYATPGEMRKSQNWIGSPGCTLTDATYVPPPLPEMNACFSDLEKYIHSDAREPALIQCALVHYQFEAIHPFLDGNGRIGRLLITFMLLEKKLLSQPLLYLSDFFEEYRDDYYRLLLNVSQKGDWKAWLTFFLNGVRQQSEDVLATIQELLDLQKQYSEVATGRRVPKTVNRLLDCLFASPIISISELSKTWGMPFPTVKRGVDYLVEKGILSEITGGRRNRLFVADEVFNVIMTERTKSRNTQKHSAMAEKSPLNATQGHQLHHS
ncbi:MAG: Fic family protein [Candidatus Poribacteria bacterium]|nr:Fic family protein [Candidatus Poribacteria bacterium]